MLLPRTRKGTSMAPAVTVTGLPPRASRSTVPSVRPSSAGRLTRTGRAVVPRLSATMATSAPAPRA
nr:hypothetical protein [Deltaproteobacteria bacterium]